MAIASRQFFDQNLNGVSAGLAKIFGPPDSGDTANYALARSRNDQSARATEVYQLARDAGVDRETLDRAMVGAGITNPSQSYYAVDKQAETQKYGYDQSYNASTQNNVRDNDRAVKTNGADNDTNVLLKILEPLNQGQSRVGITSPEIQKRTGLAADDPLLGAVMGVAPNRSVENVQAAAAERAAQADPAIAQKITDAGVAGASMPKVTYEDGTAMVDGKAVNVTRAAGSRDWVTPSGVNIGDAQVMSRTSTVGTPEQTGLGGKGTEGSDKKAEMFMRATDANRDMESTLATGYRPGVVDKTAQMDVGTGLLSTIGGYAVTPEGKKFYAASKNFLNSILRPDTGAAVTAEEYAQYADIFIPQPSDTPDVMAMKSRYRATAMAGLQGTSRGAAEGLVKMFLQQRLPVPPEVVTRINASNPGLLSQMAEQVAANAAAGSADTGTPPPGGAQGAAADAGAAQAPAAGVANASADSALAKAREAIAKGAPRDAVIKRLTDAGIPTEGL